MGNILEKQPKSKFSQKQSSGHQSGHGDANKHTLSLNEELRHIEDSKHPGNAKGSEIARNVSQTSLNSTARSPRALTVTRKALSVRDTFKEDNAAKKYVKASRCPRMIPFFYLLRLLLNSVFRCLSMLERCPC